MAISDLQRAEQLLGTLFGFKCDRAPNNNNVDLAVDYFKEYVEELRKSTDLKTKDV